MNKYKERFAQETKLRTLAEALVGADVFVRPFGKGSITQGNGVLHGAATRLSSPWPIPILRSRYEEAKACRPMSLSRPDAPTIPTRSTMFLVFPFIFRGALDVRATAINEEMKLAATHALAALAKEDVPDSVCRAYGVPRLQFGPDYLIPKPFDPRVLMWEASAVAEAAMRSGVAQEPVDLITYREQLERRLGKATKSRAP